MLANRTIMSLDQRFTRLRKGESRQQMRGGGVGGGVASGRVDFRSGGGASFKNRRLAMELAKRPAVVAALARSNFQGVSNGLGFNTPVRMRRSGVLGRGRGGLGRGGLRRSGSLTSLGGLSPGVFRGGGGFGSGDRGRPFRRSGSLSRSQSLQSLNGLGASNFRGRLGVRGRGRGRFRRGSFSAGRGGRLSRASSLQSLNGINGGFRGRGRGGRGGRRSMSVSRGFTDRRNQLRQQTGRGRGGVGGRGRGRGRGRGGGQNLTNSGRGRGRGGGRRGRGGSDQWNKGPPPSRDDLDKELDQYMASTKVSLDKELDSYMNQADEKWD